MKLFRSKERSGPPISESELSEFVRDTLVIGAEHHVEDNFDQWFRIGTASVSVAFSQGIRQLGELEELYENGALDFRPTIPQTPTESNLTVFSTAENADFEMWQWHKLRVSTDEVSPRPSHVRLGQYCASLTGLYYVKPSDMLANPAPEHIETALETARRHSIEPIGDEEFAKIRDLTLKRIENDSRPLGEGGVSKLEALDAKNELYRIAVNSMVLTPVRLRELKELQARIVTDGRSIARPKMLPDLGQTPVQ